MQRGETLAVFDRWLSTPGPWLAGLDFPFGLPDTLTRALSFRPRLGNPGQCRRGAGACPMARCFRPLSRRTSYGHQGAAPGHRQADGRPKHHESLQPTRRHDVSRRGTAIVGQRRQYPSVPTHRQQPHRAGNLPGAAGRQLIGRLSYKRDVRADRTASGERADVWWSNACGNVLPVGWACKFSVPRINSALWSRTGLATDWTPCCARSMPPGRGATPPASPQILAREPQKAGFQYRHWMLNNRASGPLLDID